ncbi:hypothetical protein ACWDTT_34405, partial [Streptosporangium sandarakinum]
PPAGRRDARGGRWDGAGAAACGLPVPYPGVRFVRPGVPEAVLNSRPRKVDRHRSGRREGGDGAERALMFCRRIGFGDQAVTAGNDPIEQEKAMP